MDPAEAAVVAAPRGTRDHEEDGDVDKRCEDGVCEGEWERE